MATPSALGSYAQGSYREIWMAEPLTEVIGRLTRERFAPLAAALIDSTQCGAGCGGAESNSAHVGLRCARYRREIGV